jgi:hypothetical protein
MTTNIKKTATTYNFNVIEGEFIYAGTCENNLSNFRIHGDIRFAEDQNDSSMEMMPSNNIGSFNYSRNENNIDLNTNIYDRSSANDILEALPSVINAVIDEINK